MARVWRPGSTVEWILPQERGIKPEERTIFIFKVLLWDEWKRYTAALEKLDRFSGEVETIECLRRVLGIALLKVKNLQLIDPDGKSAEFELERLGDEISSKSMEVLLPWKEDLFKAVREVSQFFPRDAKN